MAGALAAALLAGGLLGASPPPAGAAPAGSLDPTFGGGGVVVTDVGANTADDGSDVAVQPDGRIVVAGTSDDDILVVRYNPDGSLDTSFSGDGKVTTDVGGVDSGHAVALQDDGRIVVAGSSGDGGAFALVRYNSDGTLDTTFDGDGKLTQVFNADPDNSAEDLAVTAAGIVVVGWSGTPSDFVVARFTGAGALDPTFDTDGWVTTDLGGDDAALAVAVQPDGMIVAAGAGGAGADLALVRYEADGSPDASFDADGTVLTDLGGDEAAYAVALQPDGRIVAGGDNGAGDSALVRYTAAGGLDPTFDADGEVVTDWGADSLVTSVAVQPDGKIVTAGPLGATGPDPNFLVARYEADGGLDTTFDGGAGGDGGVVTDLGAPSLSVALALQDDGKIVVAGLAGDTTSGDLEVATARLLADATADPPAPPLGYRMVAADGGIFTFGQRTFRGSTGDLTLNKPIVGGATNPATVDGYWIVASDGGVFSFGDVGFYGSLANTALDSPVAEIEPTPTGMGYWMVTSKGKVHPFGDAVFYGDVTSLNLNQPIVGMTTTSSGQGYWLLGADGGIFSHGDAQFFGSTGDLRLNSPVVDIAGVPGDDGYFLVAGDGGVFTFGSAEFKGSTGDIKLNQPVNSMLVTPDGEGYWLAASDGGVFTFGDAPFLGSMGAVRLNAPVLDMIN